MGRVTKVPKTKATKATKATKVTTVIKVTRITTKETPGVTKVLVGVIRGRIPVGANTTHPRGGPTHLPIQWDQIKLRMIMMLAHLTCRSYLTLYRSFRMTTQSQRLFTMRIYMIPQLSPLTT